MDIKTMIIALVLGFVGTMLLGGLLNIPDGGAILSIAYIGGKVIYLLNNKNDV